MGTGTGVFIFGCHQEVLFLDIVEVPLLRGQRQLTGEGLQCLLQVYLLGHVRMLANSGRGCKTQASSGNGRAAAEIDLGDHLTLVVRADMAVGFLATAPRDPCVRAVGNRG